MAPTDVDFCNITLDGVSPERYTAFVAALPPMELPEVPRNKRGHLHGHVAYTRQENAKIALRVRLLAALLLCA